MIVRGPWAPKSQQRGLPPAWKPATVADLLTALIVLDWFYRAMLREMAMRPPKTEAEHAEAASIRSTHASIRRRYRALDLDGAA